MAFQSNGSGVVLTVPAKPDYVVLARLALSAVCRLTPLRPEDVADLKLAITEAATGLMTEDDDEDTADQLRFRFGLAADRLVLDIEGRADTGIPDEELELGRAIIEATVDEYEAAEGSMHLVKYLEASPQ
jgi:serine/threonine-protein kinase RsbW